jgi:putative glutamine amidotransferase
MKENPLILTTSFFEQTGDDKKLQITCVKSSYLDTLIALGGVPLIVPLRTSEAGLRMIAEKAGGLFLPGGDDVAPERYGAQRDEKTGTVCEEQDELEFSLVKIFKEQKKPIFGICRGMQVINVALGGTLYQDIKSEIHGALIHRDDEKTAKERYQTDAHDVRLMPKTKLHSFFEHPRIPVNSTHHQSVKKIGTGLRVAAVAEDGVIEGIEAEDMNTEWVMGVQWHPEEIWKTHKEQEVLFKKFIEAIV